MRKILLSTYIVALSYSCFAQQLSNSFKQDTSTGIKDYGNHLIFTYNSHVLLKKNGETYRPQCFELQLPKNLKYWEGINSSNFGFYYRKNQVLFITTNIFKNKEEVDSIYVPSKNELEEMIKNNFYTSGNVNWDIRMIKIIDRRKNLLIKKRGITILLLNIYKKDFEDFYKSALSFRVFHHSDEKEHSR